MYTILFKLAPETTEDQSTALFEVLRRSDGVKIAEHVFLGEDVPEVMRHDCYVKTNTEETSDKIKGFLETISYVCHVYTPPVRKLIKVI